MIIAHHPDGRVEIRFSLESAEDSMELRDYVNGVVEDTVASMIRKREFVNLRLTDDQVRFVARNAARLALGLQRNPDREITSG